MQTGKTLHACQWLIQCDTDLKYGLGNFLPRELLQRHAKHTAIDYYFGISLPLMGWKCLGRLLHLQPSFC